MNEATSEENLQGVARAIRFAFAAFIVGVSYPNIWLAVLVENFQSIYRDMLGGKPLPLLTDFVIRAEPVLVGVSILIPVLAVTLIFTLGITRSLYVYGALMIVVFVQFFTTLLAVMAPMMAILQSMQAS